MKFAAVFAALALSALPAVADARPSDAAIDAEVARAMAATKAEGVALAVIENGQITYVHAYGKRNAKGDPLTTDTVMYAASLTKSVFAYTVLQMADEGIIDLDTPISVYLKKPLPEYAGFDDAYAPWNTLDDERWRKITPRMLLTHSSGFANFYWLNPGEKVLIHFDPGTRYAYSGDGLILLQFVLEQGLGLDLGKEMQRRVFDRFGMKTSSMIWRPDFAANLADGWDAEGKPEPHDERSRVRAAGSLDTTIADFARFSAAVARGDGLSPRMRAELSKAQLPITTASQFPSLQPELPPERRRKDLAAGIGVVRFEGPQGVAFFKGGHNDSTGNTWVCVEKTKSCVVMLGNDVRIEDGFDGLVKFILGDVGAPYDWEYGGPSTKF
ncbi:MAG: beta-lactamase family protein [Caulobacter sp.]|nr:beta-lactamase family protein [Caulobacter sp.]